MTFFNMILCGGIILCSAERIYADYSGQTVIYSSILSALIGAASTYVYCDKAHQAYNKDLLCKVDKFLELSDAFLLKNTVSTIESLKSIDELIVLRRLLTDHMNECASYMQQLEKMRYIFNTDFVQRRGEYIKRLVCADHAFKELSVSLDQHEAFVQAYRSLEVLINHSERDFLVYQNQASDKLNAIVCTHWYMRNTPHGYTGFPYIALNSALSDAIDALHQQIVALKQSCPSDNVRVSMVHGTIDKAQALLAVLEQMRSDIGRNELSVQEVSRYTLEMGRLEEIKNAALQKQVELENIGVQRIAAENERAKVEATMRAAQAQEEKNAINRSHNKCHAQAAALKVNIESLARRVEEMRNEYKVLEHKYADLIEHKKRAEANSVASDNELQKRIKSLVAECTRLEAELSQEKKKLHEWEMYNAIIADAQPALVAMVAGMHDREGFPHEHIVSVDKAITAIVARRSQHRSTASH